MRDGKVDQRDVFDLDRPCPRALIKGLAVVGMALLNGVAGGFSGGEGDGEQEESSQALHTDRLACLAHQPPQTPASRLGMLP